MASYNINNMKRMLFHFCLILHNSKEQQDTFSSGPQSLWPTFQISVLAFIVMRFKSLYSCGLNNKGALKGIRLQLALLGYIKTH